MLVPPGDPAGLAARLIELLRNPRQAREMGRAGRHRAVHLGSLERMVDGYQGLLSSLLETADGRFSATAGAIR
jgi:hypothetical protein